MDTIRKSDDLGCENITWVRGRQQSLRPQTCVQEIDACLVNADIRRYE